MRTSPPQKRDRCRSCGRVLPAWLPVMQEPDGPMLVHHLFLMYPAEVGPYLERMRTEAIATVAAEAYEVVEDE
jgi:hypothetical protein